MVWNEVSFSKSKAKKDKVQIHEAYTTVYGITHLPYRTRQYKLLSTLPGLR